MREVDDVHLEVVDLVHVFAALRLVVVVYRGDLPDAEAVTEVVGMLDVLVFLLV